MYSNMIKQYIEELYQGASINLDEDTAKLVVSGKNNFNSADTFINYLVKIFQSNISKAIRIEIGSDFPINLRCLEDINILKVDIEKEYGCENISLILSKEDLKKLYIEKYHLKPDIEVKIFYGSSYIEKILISSDEYLEDILSPTKYTLLVLLNDVLYLDSISCCVINEQMIDKIKIDKKIEEYNKRKLDRIDEIKTRNKLSNWFSRTKWITPMEIYFENIEDDSLISKKIISNCIDLIIKSIANVTLEDGGTNKSIFMGSKSIELIYPSKKYTKEAMINLYELYKWIFSESSEDKITFVRNVIINMVVAKCQGDIFSLIAENSDWIYSAATEAYKDFINNSVDKYFENRFLLVDKIKNNVDAVNLKTQELISKNSNNMLGFIAAIATGLLTYSTKGGTNLLVVKVVLIGYSIFLLMNLLVYLPNVRRQSIQIEEEFLKNIEKYNRNYIVIEKLDLDTKHFDENLNRIKKSVSRTTFVYMGVIGAILIITFKPGLLEWLISMV